MIEQRTLRAKLKNPDALTGVGRNVEGAANV